MAANTGGLKKLIKEDFDKKDQALIGKVAFIINPALQTIINNQNHGLLITDLNTQQKDITITVDAKGNPTTSTSFQSTLAGQCGMIMVGRAQAVNAPGVYPTGGHSVSFTDNSGQITINNVTGLPANQQFTLRLVAYV